MAKAVETRPRDLAVALLGLAATLAGIALAIRPVRASTAVFWGVLAMAAVLACLGFGCLKRKDRSKDRSRRTLLARECRQIAAALADLLSAASKRPNGTRFGTGTERREATTLGRYERDLRGWVTQVFDQAVEAGAILPACRPLLQAESVFQLETLRTRFRDAAEALERR
jgi:hypothetical protein